VEKGIQFRDWKTRLAASGRRIVLARRRANCFFAITVDSLQRLRTHHTIIGEDTSGYLENMVVQRQKGQSTPKDIEPAKFRLGSYCPDGEPSAAFEPSGSLVFGDLIGGKYAVRATIRGQRRYRIGGEFSI
jgi:hypothetical protein